MTSCFTSEINASSGIGTRDSRDGKDLGFPITARRRICWRVKAMQADLKIAAEVLRRSARAA
jgi:hypothetical protein